MTDAPAVAGLTRRGQRRRDGISNCSNTTSAVGDDAAHVGASPASGARWRPARPRCMFSPPASTTTTAAPLGTGSVTTPSSPDAVVAQVGAQRPARGVVAERGDQCHVGAGPRGGHGLVAALAAGAVDTADASTVSPGRGSAATLNARSELTLPTTQTRAAIAVHANPPGAT